MPLIQDIQDLIESIQACNAERLCCCGRWSYWHGAFQVLKPINQSIHINQSLVWSFANNPIFQNSQVVLQSNSIVIITSTIQAWCIYYYGPDVLVWRYLRNYSRTIAGKEQLIIGAMAKAFEVVFNILCLSNIRYMVQMRRNQKYKNKINIWLFLI